jgi:hypothetical protein
MREAAMENFSVESVKQGMPIDPELQEAYTKVVSAGLKVMFDPATRNETMAYMDGEGDVAEKLGNGVGSVVLMLFKQSNETIPPQLLIPAGVELLAHAAEVMASSEGQPLSNEVAAEAMGTMIELILTKFGADPAKLQEMVGGLDSGLDPQQAAQEV